MSKEKIEALVSFGSSMILVMVLAGFVVGGYHILFQSVDKNEIADCKQLEKQADEFATLNHQFYVTPWQKTMCDRHGLTFGGTEKAPVLINEGDSFDKAIWYYHPRSGKFYFDVSNSDNVN